MITKVLFGNPFPTEAVVSPEAVQEAVQYTPRRLVIRTLLRSEWITPHPKRKRAESLTLQAA